MALEGRKSFTSAGQANATAHTDSLPLLAQIELRAIQTEGAAGYVAPKKEVGRGQDRNGKHPVLKGQLMQEKHHYIK